MVKLVSKHLQYSKKDQPGISSYISGTAATVVVITNSNTLMKLRVSGSICGRDTTDIQYQIIYMIDWAVVMFLGGTDRVGYFM